MYTLKPISCILLLVCLSAIFYNPVYAQPSRDSIRLHLKWWHQFQFAGYYAAEIKGFYKEAGLKVKIIAADKNNPPVFAVKTGQADFGVTSSDIIVDYSLDPQLVNLAAIFQHSPYVIISLKSSNIRVPSDLAGKKIMASRDQGWVELQSMFLKQGIPLDSLKILRHTWKNKDLVDEYADAMTGYISAEPRQLESQGHAVNLMLPVNYGIDFYGDVLFTTKRMLKKSPKTVEKFRAASLKGWEYAMDNPHEIALYILTLPGVKERGISLADLLYEAEEMRKLILPDLVDMGHQSESRWHHILDVHQSLGIINKDITLGDFIYNPVKDESGRMWKILQISGAAALLLLGVILIYSFSLRRAVRKRTAELQKEIKEKTRTQDRLRISEERMEMATRAAGIGIWDWNIKTDSIFISDSVASNLGYAVSELPKGIQNFKKIVHPDDLEILSAALKQHLDGSLDELNTVIRIQAMNGEWKWFLVISNVVEKDQDKRASRILGIHLNVDELKKKEVALSELSTQLLKRNAELQQFAYITSHNLRAPVANLVSLTQLFHKEVLDNHNSLYFSKIAECIHILNETITDVNTILSISAGTTEKLEEIDLQQLLQQVTHSISERIENTATVIVTDFSAAPMVMFSKNILHSVFLNLVTNAIKYRKPGEPAKIKIHAYQTPEACVIKVTDNGTGIDLEKNRHKVFQLFQRFHSGIEGKGLGLYIVKNQLESLHATIDVESIKNEGTSFVITIPR